MKRLLWKLLSKHISKAQIAGFAAANIIGLSIVLIGLQFYCDVIPLFEDEDSFLQKDYLVLTKKVGGLTALKSFVGADNNTTFSEGELSDLENQEWVLSVGKFTTSNYPIYGSVEMQGRGLRSSFFFESVPDEFIDVNSDDWHFDPENPQIPIIISKDYLSLYNFGFAASQGMPQLSEGMISMVPLVFRLTKPDGSYEYMPGKIAGFSNRLNTIIVPDEFMRWSNARYAPGITEAPSRIIVQVKALGDPHIEQYMQSRGYEISGDKLNSGKANMLLSVIMSIVVVIGLIICGLSFFILILSIYLLLQKNSRKLRDLLMLGYTPKQVSAVYIKLICGVNAAVYILSVAALLYGRGGYMPMLQGLGLHGATVLVSLSAGLLVMGIITAGNIFAIRRKINNLWLWEK